MDLSRVWYGEDVMDHVARAALRPLGAVFGAITQARNALYDRGVLESRVGAIPVISIGNLAVGGSGKTPVSAWVASKLVTRGASPAIVMRGYGDDEPLVHGLLNPGIPVITNPDRVAGVATAAERGATVAVLDDAFQHRRLRRECDVVLVSADTWTGETRPLPAGPWRESLAALTRADAVVITSKAAPAERIANVARALASTSAVWPTAILRIEAGDLRQLESTEQRPLSELAGRRVLVIAAIADPRSLQSTFEGVGARATFRFLPDHHPFSDGEIAAFARESEGLDDVVCTLKDAVKLGPRWPRQAPSLWYVSQHVRVASGEQSLLEVIERAALARSQT